MTNYIQNGSKITVSRDIDNVVYKKLPVGTYTVGVDMYGNLFLEKADDLVESGKIYGDVNVKVDRVLKTFLDRDKSTGVLLSGEKGCGKTMLAKLLAQNLRGMGVSTIVVNKPLCGDVFNNFIASIGEPCMVLFDEFEKVYSEDEHQTSALTLFDGVVTTKKLFVVTCNKPSELNENLINRPGRLFFRYDYEGLGGAFIKQYCEDNLNDKGRVGEVMSKLSFIDSVNFDMLKAIVEDMNRFNCSVTESFDNLNVGKFQSGLARYTVKCFMDGVQIFDKNGGMDCKRYFDPTEEEEYITLSFYPTAKTFDEGLMIDVNERSDKPYMMVNFVCADIKQVVDSKIIWERTVHGVDMLRGMSSEDRKKIGNAIEIGKQYTFRMEGTKSKNKVVHWNAL